MAHDHDYERRTQTTTWKALRAALTGERGAADVPTPRAALSGQSISGGAATVPPSELAPAVEIGLASSIMRRLAEVRIVPGSEDYLWAGSAPSEGEIVGAGATQDTDEPVFGQLRLGRYKYGSKEFRAPNELIEDVGPGGLPALLTIMARRIGRAQNRGFTTGTGASQSQGVVTGASVTVTRSGSSLYLDDLIDLFSSLAEEYFEDEDNPPAFMMAAKTFAVLSKQKDGSGAYAARLRKTFLRCKIHLNPHMPLISGNAAVRPILFGQFGYYKVRDSDTLRFVRSIEAANTIENDQSLLYATLRSDGGLLIADTARPPIVALGMNGG